MSANTNNIQQLYVAYFGRPADVNGLAYWENVVAAQGGDTTAVSAAFAASEEYKAGFAGLSNDQVVNTIYNNLFHRDAEPAGIAYWSLLLSLGEITVDNVVTQVAAGALTTDATALAQKVVAAEAFTAALVTTPEILSYSGNGANALAKAWLAGVFDATSEHTAEGTLPTTIASLAGAISGDTFLLTTGVDILTGTNGNDNFVADNTGATATSSHADSINGGLGIDTLKIYSAGAAATLDAIPTLTSVENLWINGAEYSTKTLDVSTITGLTGVTLDAPKELAGATVTIKETGVAVTLSNFAAVGVGAETFAIASTADTSAAVTLNGFTKAVGGIVPTLDLNGAAIKTLNLTDAGAASSITLTNTGTALKTINVFGDKAVTITDNAAVAAAVTTVNGSTDTGGFTYDASAGNVAANFAFTGGSGNDTLIISNVGLLALTSGSQLAGGGGTNTLTDTLWANSAADYTAVNATTGFQVLGDVNGGAIDASQLTSINHFAVSTVAGSLITNLASGAIVDDTVAGALTTSSTVAVGTVVLNLNINKATAAGIAITDVTTGFNQINVVSNGTSANTVAFTNSDNTNFVVTGANGLSASFVGGTTGSTFDAHGLIGALTLTDSGKGDVILTGSGVTSITEAGKFDTLTYLSGHTNAVTLNSYDTGAAGYTTGVTTVDKITNFVLNQDVLTDTFAGALTQGTELGATAGTGIVATGAFAAASNFIASVYATAGTATHAVAWSDGANTYVAEFTGVLHQAHVVELVGLHNATQIGAGAGGIIVG